MMFQGSLKIVMGDGLCASAAAYPNSLFRGNMLLVYRKCSSINELQTAHQITRAVIVPVSHHPVGETFFVVTYMWQRLHTFQ